jgi:RHS repeat-associated protein
MVLHNLESAQAMNAEEFAGLSNVRCMIYDANGNLTSDGTGNAYAYDAANRLISVTNSKGTTQFAYDGFGHRVKEVAANGAVKQWVWCPLAAEPCEERDGSNNVIKRFYWQGEQIASISQPSIFNSYYFTRDHLGSVREMTDSGGNLISRYDYDPYGRRSIITENVPADFGFTGFYYDQATGLDLTWFRAYDADLGRWLSRDPIGENGGINLYAYCLNNPIDRIDPFGLFHVAPNGNPEGSSSVVTDGKGGLTIYIGTLPVGTSQCVMNSIKVHEGTHLLDAYNQNSHIGSDKNGNPLPAGLYLMPDTLGEEIRTEIHATNAQLAYLNNALNNTKSSGCDKAGIEKEIKFVTDYRQVFYDALLEAAPEDLNGPPRNLWGGGGRRASPDDHPVP